MTGGSLGGTPRAYTVVTVAYHSGSLLPAMFERLPPPTPLIVVDNSAADEDIRELVASRPGTVYLDARGNVGFGAACNLAARVATDPLVVFVNPDADVSPVVLDRLARELAADTTRGSAGPLLTDADGGVRAGSGGWLPSPLRALVHAAALFRMLPRRGISVGSAIDEVTEVEWLAGTCLMIRRDVFLAVGGFSPRYFLYQEDMDLGRRLCDAGYRQVLVGDLRVRHVAGTSCASVDVRRLAWLRASAMVDYLAATHRPAAARLMCAILAGGALLRAALEIVRGRTARLGEFGTHAWTMLRVGRTLERVDAERQRRAEQGLAALHPSFDGGRS